MAGPLSLTYVGLAFRPPWSHLGPWALGFGPKWPNLDIYTSHSHLQNLLATTPNTTSMWLVAPMSDLPQRAQQTTREGSLILRSVEKINMGDLEPPPLKRRRRDPTSITDTRDLFWKNAICEALGLENTITDDKLQEALDVIRDPGDGTLTDGEPKTPPIITNTDGKNAHLSANILITDFDRYILKNPGISFIVIREFICCKRAAEYEYIPNPIEPTREWRESLCIASEYLCSALSKLNTEETPSEDMPVFETGKESHHWNFWAFHNRSILEMLPNLCNGIEKKHASVFSEYFCKESLPSFNSIQKLISTKKFTLQSLGYLFIPGNVVVVKSTRGEAYDMCYEIAGWPSYFGKWDVNLDNSNNTLPGIVTHIEFNLSSWQFDGNFMKVTSTNTCKIAIGAKELPTTSLSIIPFVCLTTEKQNLLFRRGMMLWKCRKMHYISYRGWDFDRLEHFVNSRFVVDPVLGKSCYKYNAAQPTQAQLTNPNPELKDDIGEEAMNQAEPPNINFLLTTPIFIWGFNMQDKAWKKLSTSNVNDVDWDEKAFDNLVIDPDTKDVIQALVTNKVQNSMSTDLLRGKGSGLILLLHGPPGTGKTLTAESVAEHAKKPLYRVTCGDIGTRPEAVEQYLKKVLRLGKSWDCVVLLDEAEVFLQERSLNDIQRNALVSVFLRTLEYYDGILILTSNRVGTFDEGFRSRIQLAIHYPKLEQADRRRVWENFVNRLSNDLIASEDIDIRNLRSNLTELSKFDLNGREIRNAITVARPLAKSEERKVDFESLKKVIKVQQKFDTYMKNVNEGLDDEEVAREEGKR
ncbi:hypothetical protein F4679DRAFT_538581 [Xylaria curta]|nr:hypothetical protein F4679DRAFT_538581 [Xylaria curta]